MLDLQLPAGPTLPSEVSDEAQALTNEVVRKMVTKY